MLRERRLDLFGCWVCLRVCLFVDETMTAKSTKRARSSSTPSGGAMRTKPLAFIATNGKKRRPGKTWVSSYVSFSRISGDRWYPTIGGSLFAGSCRNAVFAKAVDVPFQKSAEYAKDHKKKPTLMRLKCHKVWKDGGHSPESLSREATDDSDSRPLNPEAAKGYPGPRAICLCLPHRSCGGVKPVLYCTPREKPVRLRYGIQRICRGGLSTARCRSPVIGGREKAVERGQEETRPVVVVMKWSGANPVVLMLLLFAVVVVVFWGAGETAVIQQRLAPPPPPGILPLPRSIPHHSYLSFCHS
eukprot:gene7885-5510_t